jgi:DMSO/TMAO reductase YedYZ molybdopterin-dependent catalytic subunit
MMLELRRVLKGLGGVFAFAVPGLVSRPASPAGPPYLTFGLPAGEYDTAVLDALPGKQPLIKLSYRPPNYETPVSYFSSPTTANDAFFVRYHLADIPEQIDLLSWRLRVAGDSAGNPFELTMADLQSKFEQVEITAVCQCSGNRRGLSEPHVPGVQWGLGAMGSAVWTGVRLKDVLAKAELRKETVEVVLNGADGPVIDKTPDFIKSIPIWKALDENTIVAFRMNGQPLPHFNGFPARLVVPGWTATYWMKHLVSIEAATTPFQGFWMKSAYRIPNGKFPVIERFLSQETDTTTPITEMVVNSLTTSPTEGQHFDVGQAVGVSGIAWDGGYGIRLVEVSIDDGKTWHQASLGRDDGRFAFRLWSYRFTPEGAGTHRIMAKAANGVGQTQVDRLIFNPAGYHNNLIRPTTITVV